MTQASPPITTGRNIRVMLNVPDTWKSNVNNLSKTAKPTDMAKYGINSLRSCIMSVPDIENVADRPLIRKYTRIRRLIDDLTVKPQR